MPMESPVKGRERTAPDACCLWSDWTACIQDVEGYLNSGSLKSGVKACDPKEVTIMLPVRIIKTMPVAIFPSVLCIHRMLVPDKSDKGTMRAICKNRTFERGRDWRKGICTNCRIERIGITRRPNPVQSDHRILLFALAFPTNIPRSARGTIGPKPRMYSTNGMANAFCSYSQAIVHGNTVNCRERMTKERDESESPMLMKRNRCHFLVISDHTGRIMRGSMRLGV